MPASRGRRDEDPHHRPGRAAARAITQSGPPRPDSPVVRGRPGSLVPVSLKFEVNGFAPDPDGGTRAGFSATGEINRIDFGVCTNPPIVGLASAKVQIDIEAEAVLRKEE